MGHFCSSQEAFTAYRQSAEKAVERGRLRVTVPQARIRHNTTHRGIDPFKRNRLTSASSAQSSSLSRADMNASEYGNYPNTEKRHKSLY
jgi:hypothetical protein